MSRMTPRRVALVPLFALLLALGTVVVGAAPASAASAVSVHGFGGARALGAPATALNAPLVGIASNASGTGYWLLAQDGGIFSYGSAKFYGSTGARPLNQPVVGIAATRRGHGYWLVAADGGIFTFGDARFHGSTGALHVSSPIVGITSTRSGHGYWIAGADGRVFSFGDARAMHAVRTSSPIVGLARDAKGTGLWLVASDGAVFTTGTATFAGGVNGAPAQAVGIAPAAHGYWIATGPSGPPLPPNSGSGRRIVYSNSQQRLWLVEANGVVSHSYLVSGRHGLPSVGVHQVYSKVPTSPSGDLTLPWTLRFAHGSSGAPIDIHGIPLRPDGSPIEPDSLLGTPESHGCIRMNQADAEFVWNWSSVGTTVVVTDLGY
jgi:hypothetical protein